MAPCAHTTLVEEGVKFKLLDKHGKNKKKPTEVHDSGDEDTDDEKPAEEVTHAKQDRLCAVRLLYSST